MSYKLEEWCTFRRPKVVHFSTPLDIRCARDAVFGRLVHTPVHTRASVPFAVPTYPLHDHSGERSAGS